MIFLNPVSKNIYICKVQVTLGGSKGGHEGGVRVQRGLEVLEGMANEGLPYEDQY